MHVPGGVGEEAVEAGLVGGLGEFSVDATDVLALGDEQAGEVLSEVTPLRFVGQQIAVGTQCFLNHLGEFNDATHGRLQNAADQFSLGIVYKIQQLRQRETNFAKVQCN